MWILWWFLLSKTISLIFGSHKFDPITKHISHSLPYTLVLLIFTYKLYHPHCKHVWLSIALFKSPIYHLPWMPMEPFHAVWKRERARAHALLSPASVKWFHSLGHFEMEQKSPCHWTFGPVNVMNDIAFSIATAVFDALLFFCILFVSLASQTHSHMRDLKKK